MKTSIVNAFVFIMLVSAVITAAAFLLLDHLIVWLHIPKEAAPFTKEYLFIIFFGIFFVCIYNFFSSVLRSIGNTVTPLVFLAVSAVLNIILDVVFILKFGMGIAGAAWATVTAQGVSAVLITVYFFSKAGDLCPKRCHMYYSRELLGMIINNSTLTAIQQSIMNLGILMVQGLVNSFGFLTSAAFAAVVKIACLRLYAGTGFWKCFYHLYRTKLWSGKTRQDKKRSSVSGIHFYWVLRGCVCDSGRLCKTVYDDFYQTSGNGDYCNRSKVSAYCGLFLCRDRYIVLALWTLSGTGPFCSLYLADCHFPGKQGTTGLYAVICAGHRTRRSLVGSPDRMGFGGCSRIVIFRIPEKESVAGKIKNQCD